MTRAKYVDWCKARALEYLDQGDIPNAITSMLSDMSKREDTAPGPALSMLGIMEMQNRDSVGARRFIVGFN